MNNARSLLVLVLGFGLAGCVGGYESRRGGANFAGPIARRALPSDSAGASCITVQRGVRGDAHDARIVERQPTSNYGDDPVSVAGTLASGLRQTLLGFEVDAIPAGARITRATVTVHRRTCGQSALTVHRVTAPWREDTVSWQSFAGAFEEVPFATLSNKGHRSDGLVPASFDATDMVRAWAGGETPNFGMILRQERANTIVATSEADAIEERPRLEICFEPGGTPGPKRTASDTRAMRFQSN